MSTNTTPSKPKNSAPSEGVHSTPQSATTGSHVSYRTQHTQEAYKPYLAVDIAHSATIPFKKFLSLIFSLEKYPSFKDIATHEKFIARLKNYAETPAAHETARYHPFNELVTCIIELLGSSDQESIIICRNDPVLIKGSAGHRKPDCVVVRESAMSYDTRLSADYVSKEGPKENPFYWSEVFAFVEFKLENSVASRPAKSRRGKSKRPQPSHQSRSGQEKSSSGTSRYMLRSSSTHASTASSSSSVHSAIPSTSSNPVPNFIPPPHTPHTSDSRESASSKRSGDNLETPSKKRRKEDPENAEGPKLRTRTDVLIQCASYALEMLSHGGLSTHVLGALVTDGQLELLYYDRSLPVQSKPVDFLKHPSHLIAFVYCMHHATSKQWGRVDQITPRLLSEPRDNPFYGATLKLNNGIVLRLLDIVFVQHALIGRGTCVVRAEVIKGDAEKWRKESIVVKFSFTPGTRTSEGEMLQNIIKHADTPNDKWVLNHLPRVLHHEAFPADNTDDTDDDTDDTDDTGSAGNTDEAEDTDETDNTDEAEDTDEADETDETDETDKTDKTGQRDIQRRLAKYFARKGIDYEERTLQVLVMTELYPIKDMTTADTLVPVVKDIFKCYRWLYETAEVIHRDISENNLMYRRTADGTIYGVLSDFDLSSTLAQQERGPSSKQRTGTRPFMARDLLDPTPRKHLYRHDLESLFYVIIVLMFRSQKQGDERFRFEQFPDLEDWFTLAPAQLLDKKKAFFSTELPLATPAFHKLDMSVVKMRKMFNSGYLARIDHAEMTKRSQNPVGPAFDESTLGGYVDFDKFQEILDSVET